MKSKLFFLTVAFVSFLFTSCNTNSEPDASNIEEKSDSSVVSGSEETETSDDKLAPVDWSIGHEWVEDYRKAKPFLTTPGASPKRIHGITIDLADVIALLGLNPDDISEDIAGLYLMPALKPNDSLNPQADKHAVMLLSRLIKQEVDNSNDYTDTVVDVSQNMVRDYFRACPKRCPYALTNGSYQRDSAITSFK